MEDYLTPSGKMMNEYELANLTMEQVFNMLIKLDVADKALYRDFKKLSEQSIRPIRTYYTAPKLVYRPRYSPTKVYYTVPLPGAPITPGLLTGTKLRLRKAPRKSPSKRTSPTPNYFRSAPIPGSIACNIFGGKAMCESSGCTWTDGVGCS
jgi:hypothetical protein